MFDIGFWELLVVAVVALIVVGPDRLPGLVRTTGRWIGRARHYAGVLRDEFEREAARAEELKELAQMRIELEEKERALAARRPAVPVDGRPALRKEAEEAPPVADAQDGPREPLLKVSPSAAPAVPDEGGKPRPSDEAR